MHFSTFGSLHVFLSTNRYPALTRISFPATDQDELMELCLRFRSTRHLKPSLCVSPFRPPLPLCLGASLVFQHRTMISTLVSILRFSIMLSVVCLACFAHSFPFIFDAHCTILEAYASIDRSRRMQFFISATAVVVTRDSSSTASELVNS